MKTTALFILLALLVVRPAAAFPLRDSLAMFESGATSPKPSSADHARGASGEVSRFQIMPDVWRAYDSSQNYTDPEIAWSVARRILDERITRFQSTVHRAPTPLETYLLWNKPGHFEYSGYDVANVRQLYRERAQRFENLFKSLNNPTPITGAQ